MLMTLHMMKAEEYNFSQIINLGYTVAKDKLTQEDIDNMPRLYNQIKDMDETQMEITADMMTNGLIKEKQYLSLLTVFLGLFEP
jgi:hypothetical protein